MSPEIADAVEALLAQRKNQGFDTPPETVAEALAQLIAGVGISEGPAEADPSTVSFGPDHTGPTSQSHAGTRSRHGSG